MRGFLIERPLRSRGTSIGLSWELPGRSVCCACNAVGWSRQAAATIPAGIVAAACLLQPTALQAQQTERPGNSQDNPIDVPRDLSGLSIKNPRIRVVHTDDPGKEGGSMYLQQVDPWLGYQWGRSLSQRNFRERDGVYGDAGKLDGIVLP